MKREIWNYIVSTSETGKLLNAEEMETLNTITNRLQNPAWNDERDYAERLKGEQEELREIVLTALDRLCNSAIESHEGAQIVARMGFGEVSEMDNAASRATREIVTMMAAIRAGHPLDPDKILDGEFMLTE